MATYTTIPTFTAGQVLTSSTMNNVKNNLDLANAQSAYATRNLIHNGNAAVAQRGTSAASKSTTGFWLIDRWQQSIGTAGTWTITQEADGPTASGIRTSAKVNCTTANASLGAGSYFLYAQALEGQDVQRILKGTASAQALTLTFWVKSNVTGTYVVEISDVTNTRQVSAAYTVSASATWEQKSVTFPADTTGVIANDANAGLQLSFWLAAGTTYSSGTLATTWHTSTTTNRATGQTNLAAATSNYWQVTGVQLETGSVSTPFEFMTYGDELRRCQRYYANIAVHTDNSTEGASIAVVHWYDGSNGYGYVKFPTTMRSKPNLDIIIGAGYYQWLSQGANGTVSTLSVQEAGTNQATITIAAANTAGRSGWIRTSNTNARVAFSAEL